MFTYRLTIQLADTDAYSILFFAHQFRFCQVVFQDWLASVGEPLPIDRDHAKFLAVCVHAESDYAAAVRVGDQLTIDYRIAAIGTTSFVNAFAMRNQHGVLVGSARVTYVTVDPRTGGKFPIPDYLRPKLAANQG